MTVVLKRLRSVQVVVLSFVLIIFIGSLLLSLPIANNSPASYIDHLFTSVSSVCVTGLVILFPVQQYTYFGQAVMIVLIQIGGLSLMTLIAFFRVQLGKKFRQKERALISESTSRSSMADLKHYLRAIIKYTLFFEGIGFCLLCIRFIPQFGLGAGMFRSLYLCVSAFCNAGFDNIGLTNLIPYANDALVSLTVCFLIITGGIGFLVWFDLSHNAHSLLRCGLKKTIKALKVHTRVILILTALLLVSGAVLVFVFEYSNPATIGSASLPTKILASFFQSTTTRTAGFSTIPIGQIRNSTALVMIVLMLIGGSPSGTAGGFKTSTLLLVILFLIKEISGRESAVIFKRSISEDQLKRAVVVMSVFLMVYLIGFFLLVMIHPELSALGLAFEAASAIGTVGLSMDVTLLLSVGGKIIVMMLMFIGRVGPLSIIYSLRHSHHHRSDEVHYAKTEIYVG